MIDPATIMLVSGLSNMASSAYRNYQANEGLDELAKQRRPRFMDAANPFEENKQMYGQMAKFGMGPASLNIARNNFAAGQNALTAAPANGQLRTQIGRMASANAGGFANSLAAQNEGFRRSALGGVAQANTQISGLQQRDVGTDLNRMDKTEAALGQAAQDSRRELMSGLTSLATGAKAYENLKYQRALGLQYYGLKDPYAAKSDADPALNVATNTDALRQSPMQLGNFSTPAQRVSNPYFTAPPLNYGSDIQSLPGVYNYANPYKTNNFFENGSFAGVNQATQDYNDRMAQQQQQRDIDQRSMYIRPYPERSARNAPFDFTGQALPSYLNAYGAKNGPFGQVMFNND